MSRASFDSKFCAVWRAMFESFVQIDGGLAPVYRYLIRSRAAVLQGAGHGDRDDVAGLGFKTASSFVQLGATPAELGAPLRAYVDEIPPSAVAVIGVRPELVGPSGALEPLGVIAGMVFAMGTRSSYSAPLNWFQRLAWWRVSCILRGMVPSAPGAKSVQKSRPGFVEIANKDRFDEQCGLLPAQPDDKSRAREANLLAARPMFEGKFRVDVAQRRGYRTPTLSDYEEGAKSGV